MVKSKAKCPILASKKDKIWCHLSQVGRPPRYVSNTRGRNICKSPLPYAPIFHSHELFGAPLGEGDPVCGCEPVVGRVDPRDRRRRPHVWGGSVVVVDVIVAHRRDRRGQRPRLGKMASP